MRFQRLQNFIMAIMLGCALVLSLISGIIAYQMIQRQSLAESYELARDLSEAIRPTAAAAVFSGNQVLAQDAINGLLGNHAIYSVELIGYADDSNKGFKLSGVNKIGGSGLDPVTVKLNSLFDEQVMGQLTIRPRLQWTQKNTAESAINTIMTLVVVIFATGFITAQLIKWWISRPLVDVVNQLQQVTPGCDQRLSLAEHLKPNEIGWLVAEFNNMLDRMKEAILTERGLRHDMELVQQSLERAKVVAEQATEAKSNFLATMSHEIRTPMNSVLGFLDLALQSSDLGTQTRRHLQVAQSSARFLLQLINDILDVSKIESGKLELDSHPFDLAVLLSETHELMEIKAQQKKLALNLEMPDTLAPSYRSDPYRLRQILINLVGNAIKFTDKGSVDMVVKGVGDNRFEFAIVDTGIGIAEDKIDSILQPFTQVDASITRQYGGTGLGTTISAELVQLLGGELKIQSILGKGSRFYFTITLEPLAQAPNDTTPESVERPVEPLKILLVDDVAENILLAKIHLERAGHKIASAENGLKATEATAKENFDLVLMDIQMPEMDGYEATRIIKGQNRHNAAMPIVAMTANAMKEDLEKVKQAGMKEVVVKPIDFAKLFATLNKVCGKSAGVKDKEPLSAEGGGPEVLIDVQSAMVSWLDEQIYLKALAGFVERNQPLPEQLAQTIDNGDVAKADALVHRVKGTAGNLRLVALFNACTELESQLRGGFVQLEPSLFEPMIKVLTETIAEIRSLTGNKSSEVSSHNIRPMDKGACGEIFADLLQACEHHDPDAAEAAFELLGRYVSDEQLIAVNERLLQFDFHGAVALINELAETLAVEIDIT